MKNSIMQTLWPLVLALTLFRSTAFAQNTAYGVDALKNNTTGNGNSAFGFYTLLSNTTGNYNSAFGYYPLELNTTGSGNSAFGSGAAGGNISGLNNTAFGFLALEAVDQGYGGNENTGVGSFVETNQVRYCCSVAVGSEALGYVGGLGNTGIGNNAGLASSCCNGDENDTFLGTGTIVMGTAVSNATALGANAEADANNNLVLGSVNGKNRQTVTVKVGIGTTSPDNNLTVNGTADKPGGGSWGTYSDGRLKNVDGHFKSGLSQILKINPVRYRYKQDNAMGIQDTDEHVGVVAQEVQKVIPEAVTENNTGYLLLNNDPIVWAMLNSIKGQQNLIHQQRVEIGAQQAELEAQQSQIKARLDRSQIREAQIRELMSQIKTIGASLNSEEQDGTKVREVKVDAPIEEQ